MKIVLACGGTGGHIFPAFAVAEELRDRFPDCRVLYICGKKDIENAIFKAVHTETVLSIDSAPLDRRAPLSAFPFLLKLSQGFSQSRRFFRRERPDLVAGFGGYVSFPALAAAKSLGIQTLIHEQNVVPGAANRLMARFAGAVALSYEETRSRLPGSRRTRVTGNPIRKAIERPCRNEALAFFGFSPEKTTMLVLGGSQGAESINAFFIDSLSLWSDELKNTLQVLHLCGRMKPAESEAACAAKGVQARAFSFFEKMDLAYGAADFAVGRAGATFLAEIETKKMPAVLVPYPYGDGHQRYNAEAFARRHQATVIEQKDLSAKKMAELISSHAAAARTRPRTVASPPRSRNARTELTDFILECLPR